MKNALLLAAILILGNAHLACEDEVPSNEPVSCVWASVIQKELDNYADTGDEETAKSAMRRVALYSMYYSQAREREAEAGIILTCAPDVAVE